MACFDRESYLLLRDITVDPELVYALKTLFCSERCHRSQSAVEGPLALVTVVIIRAFQSRVDRLGFLVAGAEVHGTRKIQFHVTIIIYTSQN